MQTVLGKWTDDSDTQPTSSGGGSSSGLGKDIGGTIAGTAGQILAAPLSPLGMIGVGAGASGLGGYVGEGIDELINSHRLDFDKMARAGTEQAAYGAIPGIPEVRGAGLAAKLLNNVFGKTALRAGTGVAGSAAAQYIDHGQIDPTQALEAGGINAALPVLKPLVNNRLTRFVGQKVPADITAALAQGDAKVKNLIDRAQGAMVGHNNVQFARQHGIIDPTHEFTAEGLNTAKDRATALANATEAALQKELQNQMEYKYPSEFMPGLLNIPESHGLPPDSEAMEQINNIISYAIRKELGHAGDSAATIEPIVQKFKQGGLAALNPTEHQALLKQYSIEDLRDIANGKPIGTFRKADQQTAAQTIPKDNAAMGKYVRMGGAKPGTAGPPGYLKHIPPPPPGQAPEFAGAATGPLDPPEAGTSASSVIKDIVEGNYPISLSTVNNLKRVLGQHRDESPMHREMYHYLKEFITGNMKKGSLAEQLNGKHAKLIDIKKNLQNNLLRGQVQASYDPEAIAAIKDSIGTKHPASLNVLLGALGSAATGAGALATHSFGLGPVADVLEPLLGLGATGASLRVPMSREVQEKIAHQLSTRYHQAGDTLTRSHIEQLLQQLGIRLPAINSAQ